MAVACKMLKTDFDDVKLREELATLQGEAEHSRVQLDAVTRERDELRAATVGMASLSGFAEDLSTDPDV